MAFYQTHFQNAQHLEVNGGHFFNIAHVNNGPNSDPVSTTLWQHVAYGAIFDSAERHPPGKCHPGTREKMIAKIVAWIDDPNPTERILWIYGLAGAGKSALAHTICERLGQNPDRRVVSFFFARGLTDRGKGLKFFATLSYQLALQFPSMRAEINEALYRDPSLPTKSMEAQLFSLVIQPLLKCRPFPSHSPTVIIDGLDECADDQGVNTQRDIIMLISRSIVEYNIPLRFMIASRPESWIRDTFESSPLPSITLCLSLRDDQDADTDIRTYLIDGFEKIRVENKRIMGSVVPPWPPSYIIECFVYEASGQFIYASTILGFVGNSGRFSDPQEQLRILTSTGPCRAPAFSELDRLYQTIISVYPRWATMKLVLGGLLVDANTTVIQVALGVNPTEIVLVLDALSALIDIKHVKSLPEHGQLLEPIYGSLSAGREEISLCHLSFREFLEDETRSGAFHIHVGDIIDEIIKAFSGIIHRNLDQNYTTEPNLLLNIGLGAYQNMMDVVSSQCIPPFFKRDILLVVVNGITQRLLVFDPPRQIDSVKRFLQDMDSVDNMVFNIDWLQAQRTTNAFESPPIEAEELMDSLSELKVISTAARKKGTDLLPLSREFRVTPTLVFLDDEVQVEKYLSPTVDTLFTIPGQAVPDVLSTLQQHCHIIKIDYRYDLNRWSVHIANLDDTLLKFEDRSREGGWRTRGEWKHQRILLVFHYLNETLNNCYDKKHRYRYLGQFFKSTDSADIHTKEYFQNPTNLSILGLLTDLSSWTNLASFRPETWKEVGHFVTPVICWFHRQLTNANTRALLENHEKELVPKMRTTIQHIIKHNFLPNFGDSYYSELYVSTLEPETSIKIIVLPFTESGYREEKIGYIPPQSLYPEYWRPFHDELFGETSSTEEGSSCYGIDRMSWHPYLASCLLNGLVKTLYGKMNSEFFGEKGVEISRTEFVYIVQCLPYAQTTQRNLDSLRAILYLLPPSGLRWDLPAEFWSLTVEFLKKYDQSILSKKELNLFEERLDYMRQTDTKIHTTGDPDVDWLFDDMGPANFSIYLEEFDDFARALDLR